MTSVTWRFCHRHAACPRRWNHDREATELLQAATRLYRWWSPPSLGSAKTRLPGPEQTEARSVSANDGLGRTISRADRQSLEQRESKHPNARSLRRSRGRATEYLPTPNRCRRARFSAASAARGAKATRTRRRNRIILTHRIRSAPMIPGGSDSTRPGHERPRP